MEFSPVQHAILFALITRQVFQRIGDEQGAMIVCQAVRVYGEQRGRRMAKRVLKDHRPLDMFNFLVYGEWSAPAGQSQGEWLETDPHLHSQVSRCPWYGAWIEMDLLAYGRYYCQEIDQALLRGYNPMLHLEVIRTMANGGDTCNFIFHEAGLNPARLEQFIHAKEIDPGSRIVMPWTYHLGHLYKTMGAVLEKHLGEQGIKAVEAGLSEFEIRFGAEAGAMIRAYQKTDFDQLLEIVKAVDGL